jgi:hypothetical protein
MLQFALSHNALAQWKKVIASSSLEPLSHPEVIALSKLTSAIMCNAFTFSSNFAGLWSLVFKVCSLQTLAAFQGVIILKTFY